MKNIGGRIFNLALAVLAALAGFLFAGCGDGSIDEGQVPVASCDGLAGEIVVVDNSRGRGTTIEENELVICTGWSALKAYGQGDARLCLDTLTAAPYYLPETQARFECEHVMTASECSDSAHAYLDSAGVRHTFGLKYTEGNTMVLAIFGVLTPCPVGQTYASICTASGKYGTYVGSYCR